MDDLGTEADVNVEYMSDTYDCDISSSDDDSNVEITFGPWPPFPSNHEQPSVDLEMEEQNPDQNSPIQELEDDIIDDQHAKSDDATINKSNNRNITSMETNSSCLDDGESAVNKNDNGCINMETNSSSLNFAVESTDSNGKIDDRSLDKVDVTDSSRHDTRNITDNASVAANLDCCASAVDERTPDRSVTDADSQTASTNTLLTEHREHTSNCAQSLSGEIARKPDSVHHNVQSISIKEEPDSEIYPNTSESWKDHDYSRFVTDTEDGRMFLRPSTSKSFGKEELKATTASTSSATQKAPGRIILHPVKNKRVLTDDHRKGTLVLVDKKTMKAVSISNSKTSGVTSPAVNSPSVNSVSYGDSTPSEKVFHRTMAESADEDGKSVLDNIASTSSATQKAPGRIILHPVKHKKVLTDDHRKGTLVLVDKKPMKAVSISNRKTSGVTSPTVNSPSVSAVSYGDSTPSKKVFHHATTEPADEDVKSILDNIGRVDLSLLKTEPEEIKHPCISDRATGRPGNVATTWIKREALSDDVIQSSPTGTLNSDERSGGPVPISLIKRDSTIPCTSTESSLQQVAETVSQQIIKSMQSVGNESIVVKGQQAVPAIRSILPKGGNPVVLSEETLGQPIKLQGGEKKSIKLEKSILPGRFFKSLPGRVEFSTSVMGSPSPLSKMLGLPQSEGLMKGGNSGLPQSEGLKGGNSGQSRTLRLFRVDKHVSDVVPQSDNLRVVRLQNPPSITSVKQQAVPGSLSDNSSSIMPKLLLLNKVLVKKSNLIEKKNVQPPTSSVRTIVPPKGLATRVDENTGKSIVYAQINSAKNDCMKVNTTITVPSADSASATDKFVADKSRMKSRSRTAIVCPQINSSKNYCSNVNTTITVPSAESASATDKFVTDKSRMKSQSRTTSYSIVTRANKRTTVDELISVHKKEAVLASVAAVSGMKAQKMTVMDNVLTQVSKYSTVDEHTSACDEVANMDIKAVMVRDACVQTDNIQGRLRDTSEYDAQDISTSGILSTSDAGCPEDVVMEQTCGDDTDLIMDVEDMDSEDFDNPSVESEMDSQITTESNFDPLSMSRTVKRDVDSGNQITTKSNFNPLSMSRIVWRRTIIRTETCGVNTLRSFYCKTVDVNDYKLVIGNTVMGSNVKSTTSKPTLTTSDKSHGDTMQTGKVIPVTTSKEMMDKGYVYLHVPQELKPSYTSFSVTKESKQTFHVAKREPMFQERKRQKIQKFLRRREILMREKSKYNKQIEMLTKKIHGKEVAHSGKMEIGMCTDANGEGDVKKASGLGEKGEITWSKASDLGEKGEITWSKLNEANNQTETGQASDCNLAENKNGTGHKKTTVPRESRRSTPHQRRAFYDPDMESFFDFDFEVEDEVDGVSMYDYVTDSSDEEWQQISSGLRVDAENLYVLHDHTSMSMDRTVDGDQTGYTSEVDDMEVYVVCADGQSDMDKGTLMALFQGHQYLANGGDAEGEDFVLDLLDVGDGDEKDDEAQNNNIINGEGNIPETHNSGDIVLPDAVSHQLLKIKTMLALSLNPVNRGVTPDVAEDNSTEVDVSSRSSDVKETLPSARSLEMNKRPPSVGSSDVDERSAKTPLVGSTVVNVRSPTRSPSASSPEINQRPPSVGSSEVNERSPNRSPSEVNEWSPSVRSSEVSVGLSEVNVGSSEVNEESPAVKFRESSLSEVKERSPPVRSSSEDYQMNVMSATPKPNRSYTSSTMEVRQSTTPRPQEVTDRSPSPRPQEVTDRSTSPRLQEVTDRSPSPRLQEVTDRSPSPRPQEVTDRSPSPRPQEVTDRSPSPRPQEVTDRSTSPRPQEVTERSPSPRPQEVTDRSPSPRLQEVTDRIPPPRPQEVTDRSTSPRPQQVTDRSPSPRPQEVTERSSSPRPQEVTDRSTSPRPQEVTDRSPPPRPQEVTDRSPPPRPVEVTDRSPSPRPQEVTDRSPSPGPQEATDRSPPPRPQEVTDGSTSPRPQEVTDRSPSPRPQEVTHRSPSPRPQEVTDRSPPPRPQEVTDRSTSPEGVAQKSPRPIPLRVIDMSSAKVIWSQMAGGDGIVVEIQETDFNNNECSQFATSALPPNESDDGIFGSADSDHHLVSLKPLDLTIGSKLPAGIDTTGPTKCSNVEVNNTHMDTKFLEEESGMKSSQSSDEESCVKELSDLQQDEVQNSTIVSSVFGESGEALSDQCFKTSLHNDTAIQFDLNNNFQDSKNTINSSNVELGASHPIKDTRFCEILDVTGMLQGKISRSFKVELRDWVSGCIEESYLQQVDASGQTSGPGFVHKDTTAEEGSDRPTRGDFSEYLPTEKGVQDHIRLPVSNAQHPNNCSGNEENLANTFYPRTEKGVQDHTRLPVSNAHDPNNYSGNEENLSNTFYPRTEKGVQHHTRLPVSNAHDPNNYSGNEENLSNTFYPCTEKGVQDHTRLPVSNAHDPNNYSGNEENLANTFYPCTEKGVQDHTRLPVSNAHDPNNYSGNEENLANTFYPCTEKGVQDHIRLPVSNAHDPNNYSGNEENLANTFYPCTEKGVQDHTRLPVSNAHDPNNYSGNEENLANTFYPCTEKGVQDHTRLPVSNAHDPNNYSGNEENLSNTFYPRTENGVQVNNGLQASNTQGHNNCRENEQNVSHIHPDLYERMLMQNMYSPQITLTSNSRPDHKIGDDEVNTEEVISGQGDVSTVGTNACPKNDAPLNMLCSGKRISEIFPRTYLGERNTRDQSRDANFSSCAGRIPKIKNLQLPDNIPELLCQRALPKPGCIAYAYRMVPRYRTSEAPLPDVPEKPRMPTQLHGYLDPVCIPSSIGLPAAARGKKHPKKPKSKPKRPGNCTVLSQILGHIDISDDSPSDKMSKSMGQRCLSTTDSDIRKKCLRQKSKSERSAGYRTLEGIGDSLESSNTASKSSTTSVTMSATRNGICMQELQSVSATDRNIEPNGTSRTCLPDEISNRPVVHPCWPTSSTDHFPGPMNLSRLPRRVMSTNTHAKELFRPYADHVQVSSDRNSENMFGIVKTSFPHGRNAESMYYPGSVPYEICTDLMRSHPNEITLNGKVCSGEQGICNDENSEPWSIFRIKKPANDQLGMMGNVGNVENRPPEIHHAAYSNSDSYRILGPPQICRNETNGMSSAHETQPRIPYIVSHPGVVPSYGHHVQAGNLGHLPHPHIRSTSHPDSHTRNPEPSFFRRPEAINLSVSANARLGSNSIGNPGIYAACMSNMSSTVASGSTGLGRARMSSAVASGSTGLGRARMSSAVASGSTGLGRARMSSTVASGSTGLGRARMSSAVASGSTGLGRARMSSAENLGGWRNFGQSFTQNSGVHSSVISPSSRSYPSQITGVANGGHQVAFRGIPYTGMERQIYAEQPNPISAAQNLDQSHSMEIASECLTTGQAEDQPCKVTDYTTDHNKVDKDTGCCKCWSRGKCRSCGCSKTGCYNCRNPICCFKHVGGYISPPIRHSGKKVKRLGKDQLHTPVTRMTTDQTQTQPMMTNTNMSDGETHEPTFTVSKDAGETQRGGEFWQRCRIGTIAVDDEEKLQEDLDRTVSGYDGKKVEENIQENDRMNNSSYYIQRTVSRFDGQKDNLCESDRVNNNAPRVGTGKDGQIVQGGIGGSLDSNGCLPVKVMDRQLVHRGMGGSLDSNGCLPVKVMDRQLVHRGMGGSLDSNGCLPVKVMDRQIVQGGMGGSLNSNGCLPVKVMDRQLVHGGMSGGLDSNGCLPQKVMDRQLVQGGMSGSLDSNGCLPQKVMDRQIVQGGMSGSLDSNGCLPVKVMDRQIVQGGVDSNLRNSGCLPVTVMERDRQKVLGDRRNNNIPGIVRGKDGEKIPGGMQRNLVRDRVISNNEYLSGTVMEMERQNVEAGNRGRLHMGDRMNNNLPGTVTGIDGEKVQGWIQRNFIGDRMISNNCRLLGTVDRQKVGGMEGNLCMGDRMNNNVPGTVTRTDGETIQEGLYKHVVMRGKESLPSEISTHDVAMKDEENLEGLVETAQPSYALPGQKMFTERTDMEPKPLFLPWKWAHQSELVNESDTSRKRETQIQIKCQELASSEDCNLTRTVSNSKIRSGKNHPDQSFEDMVVKIRAGSDGMQEETGKNASRKRICSVEEYKQECHNLSPKNNVDTAKRRARKRRHMCCGEMSDDNVDEMCTNVMDAKMRKCSEEVCPVDNNTSQTNREFDSIVDENNNDTVAINCLAEPKDMTVKNVKSNPALPRRTAKKNRRNSKSSRKIFGKRRRKRMKKSIHLDQEMTVSDVKTSLSSECTSLMEPKRKGRPRKRPLPKPKDEVPDISVSLEDHKDKYEVTQFISFHKKDRNVEMDLKSFERFTCRLCCGMYQYNTPDQASMEEHLTQHLSGRLTCDECGKTFSQMIHVQEHRQKEHKTATFTCELCAKQFFNGTTLKRHLCKAHGHKLFMCKQCKESYSSVDQLKLHIYETHGGEASKCEKCGVISLSQKAAEAHSKSKACIGRNENNVPCPYCQRILCVSQMAHHVKRIHLKVHTYRCDQCPYTTLARTALNNHMMMHQGVHPFHCELCPFSCVKSYQLSSHMRTHTGVKPYRCDQCSYAAAWNVQLKDHMRAHVSPHCILCEKCGILYKDGRCLNLHNKKVHTPKQEPDVNVTDVCEAKVKVKDVCVKQRKVKRKRSSKDMEVSELDPRSMCIQIKAIDPHREKNETCTEHKKVKVTVTGQKEVIVNGQKEVTVTGQKEVTVTGQKEVTVTGQKEVIVNGQKEVTVTGQKEVTVTGQKEVTVTGQKEVIVNGQKEVTVTGQKEVTVTGQKEVTVTGQKEVTVTGQKEFAVTGQNEVTVTGQNEVTVTGKNEVKISEQIEIKVTRQNEVKVTGPNEVKVTENSDACLDIYTVKEQSEINFC